MFTAVHTQCLLQCTRDYPVYLSLSHPLPATTKATILLHMLLIREHIFSTSGYCCNHACSQETACRQTSKNGNNLIEKKPFVSPFSQWVQPIYTQLDLLAKNASKNRKFWNRNWLTTISWTCNYRVKHRWPITLTTFWAEIKTFSRVKNLHRIKNLQSVKKIAAMRQNRPACMQGGLL